MMLELSFPMSLKSVLSHHLLQPSLSQRRRSANFTSTREPNAIDDVSGDNRLSLWIEELVWNKVS